MNAVMHDKCVARRIARAGCVEALGIVRVRHSAESTRVASNAERMRAWRNRANEPGRGNPIFASRWNITVPKSRPPVRDCPQGETPWKPLVIVTQDPQPFTTRSGTYSREGLK